MTERPILFSGPMVRALLDGRKTQTRRGVKPQPEFYNPADGFPLSDGRNTSVSWRNTHIAPETLPLLCPYGKPGDVLWVRESCWVYGKWHPNGLNKRGGQRWRFEAIGREAIFENPGYEKVAHWGGGKGWAHRPSIHMPRWASRISLRVTDVRVERLNDCSEADARAEGIEHLGPPDKDGRRHLGVPGLPIDAPTGGRAYAALWDHINGPGAWAANPWVWAVSFEVAR